MKSLFDNFPTVITDKEIPKGAVIGVVTSYDVCSNCNQSLPFSYIEDGPMPEIVACPFCRTSVRLVLGR